MNLHPLDQRIKDLLGLPAETVFQPSKDRKDSEELRKMMEAKGWSHSHYYAYKSNDGRRSTVSFTKTGIHASGEGLCRERATTYAAINAIESFVRAMFFKTLAPGNRMAIQVGRMRLIGLVKPALSVYQTSLLIQPLWSNMPAVQESPNYYLAPGQRAAVVRSVPSDVELTAENFDSFFELFMRGAVSC